MASENGGQWPRIWAVFLTGVAAAFLVGKAPAALPVLRTELNLSLFQTGLVVSMFSLVAAVAGLFFGALSDKWGQLRLALVGLVLAAAAGAAGAAVDTGVTLIASRVVEGVGFFMISVSLPGLVLRLADDRTRQTAMGLWGAYLPLGAGMILLAGGVVIESVGWRGLWLLISASYVVFFAALVWAAPREPNDAPGVGEGRVKAVLKTPGAVMLGAVFGCYSGQYMAVTSFVPLILVERAGWDLAPAAAVGAMIMVVNTTGNIAAGFLLDRGVRRQALILLASAAMALGAVMVMSAALPVPVRIAGAVLFSSFGGMIPGSLFAGVARHAPSRAHVSSVNGLMLQCVAIGQLIGPAVTTWLVATGNGSWTMSLVYLLPMAALTAIAGMVLGRIERAPA
ncbi:MFS transporter [Anderseniella sp. Alg231-50]|uniref:MFS transporter n=1 Tax=Anderseniella sp. Alg231-50 TaxID=1922226 RepID=UPI00307B4F84